MLRARTAIVLAAGFALTQAAGAAVTPQLIFTGTPTNGGVQMTGWEGVIVRLVSTDGPIERIELPFVAGGGISGSLAHRRDDPTGQSDYTGPASVAYPGFHEANNSFPSDLNFDTHLLGDPSHFVIHELGEWENGFFQRTGVPSTPFVGYGATLPMPTSDPFIGVGSGSVYATYDILPTFQSNTFDLAYIVIDSHFTFSGTAFVSGASERFDAYVLIPEPTSLAAGAGLVLLASRRRRPRRGAPPCMQTLEQRWLLSLTPPTGVTATFDHADNSVHLDWNDTTGESGYYMLRNTEPSEDAEVVDELLPANAATAL